MVDSVPVVGKNLGHNGTKTLFSIYVPPKKFPGRLMSSKRSLGAAVDRDTHQQTSGTHTT